MENYPHQWTFSGINNKVETAHYLAPGFNEVDVIEYDMEKLTGLELYEFMEETSWISPMIDWWL